MSYGEIDDLFQISGEERRQLAWVLKDWLSIKSYQLGTKAPPTLWMQAAMRGARSQETPDHVTSLDLEAVSAADSRTRDLSVIEAAHEIGISPGHLHRLIRAKTPALMLAITQTDPLRLDQTAIKAYAADHPNRKRAA